jgi:capsular polysaccharide biosynthesis protein
LFHQHRSLHLGKAHPGGNALALGVESVAAWCSRTGAPIRRLIPGFDCPQIRNRRFGNCPAEPNDPPSKVPDACIAEIRNAVIVPGHELVLVDDERVALFDRLCHLQDRNNLMEDDVVRLVAPDRIVADLGPALDRTIKAGIFMLDQFWYNYAHWLLEVLPRLALLEACPEYRSLPLLVNEKLYPQQLDALRMLNRDHHPIEVLPIGKRIRVERLIHPSNLTTSMLMRYRPSAPASSMDVALHPQAVAFLRERLIPRGDSTGKPGRRIWVSRKTKRQAGNRRMVNEEEIEALFRDVGFEIIVPESLSFREQVGAFAGAAMVAGCAGAGMINSIFSPAGTRILMFTKNHPQVNFHYFTNIAAAAGQSIAYVCGETLKNFGVHGFEADFQVSPQVARQAIREFLEA